eukprot:TRINITY_DN11215_c0_g1_i4.p1 TRINITY_DN11215_c0_g1~~TRINITY_DN11215_c0_g1_i4.p1  ORF type:complete len:146 (+),score=27.56 TRINITY_DN11215_c0_g1_i4:78-515(+)
MIRRPPRSTLSSSSAASDVYKRQVQEEVGVELDPTFEPLLAANYNQPRARDGAVNDHFMLFVVRAKSKTLRIDHNEVQQAKWFDVNQLHNIYQRHEQLEFPQPYIEADGEKIGVMEIVGIGNFMEGRCRTLKSVATRRPWKSFLF